jgi:ketosteroid isomerase-like protein
MILGRQPHETPAASGEFVEDAATVRAAYRTLSDGDARLDRYFDQRITWVDPAVARLPFDGTRRGLPAVLRAAFRRDENGDGPRVSAETFLELGDGVLVAGRFLVDGGLGTGEPFLHECSVRDGRISCIREYPAAS